MRIEQSTAKSQELTANNQHPFIIPVFIPNVGCPHQCVFCNQRAITGVTHTIPSPEELRLQITKFLKYKKSEYSSEDLTTFRKLSNLVQIAFYGGNFLGLKDCNAQMLLSEANHFVQEKLVDSIRFSTRPDTITNERLDMIKDFPVSTIEIGVQSMDDEVLSLSKRGHTALDTERAVQLLKKRGLKVGLQIMAGLPGDNETKALETTHKIIELSPDFVRIYPTVVFKNTLLARCHKSGKYQPLSLEFAVTLVKKMYQLLKEKNIKVIRMGLQATEDFEKDDSILAGPYHPAFGHLVHSEIFLDMAVSGLRSQVAGRRSHIFESSQFSILNSQFSIVIRVHPRSISKIRGLKNRNIELLKKKFPIEFVRVIPDSSISEDSLKTEIL